MVDVSESSLFGNSGELIREMRLLMWEQREEDRDMIEEVIQKLMNIWWEPISAELKIVSPFENISNGTTDSNGGSVPA